MKGQVRIVEDFSGDAWFNMAADRYLLVRAGQERSVYLRFYTWSPPAVSLGCFQDPEDTLDMERLGSEGVDYVVRSTGGRSILHKNDLTYTVVFPKDTGVFGKSIASTYRILAGWLLRGFSGLGINGDLSTTHLNRKEVRSNLSKPCFLAPNRNEITVERRKLVGSAQKRTEKAVLQHGSIPITGEFRDLPMYLRRDESDRSDEMAMLERKCLCINDLDKSITQEEVKESMINAFEKEFDLRSRRLPWEEEELLKIENERVSV